MSTGRKRIGLCAALFYFTNVDCFSSVYQGRALARFRTSRLHSSVASVDQPSESSINEAVEAAFEMPQLIEFNQELNSVAESTIAAPTPHDSVAAAHYVESQWLAHINQTDVVTFNTVLKAWSRCSQRMNELRTGAIRDHSAPWNDSVPRSSERVAVYTPNDAILRASGFLEDPPEGVEPDLQSYNIVLDGWAKKKDAVHEVETLFKRLNEHEELEPDIHTYNALLNAYTYASKIPNRVEQMRKMWAHITKVVQPNRITITSLMHGYATEAQLDPDFALDYAAEAMEIFEKACADENIELDVSAYTTVMDCWARSARGSPREPQHQVEGLLARLIEQYKLADNDEDRKRFAPTVVTYSTLFKTWSYVPTNYIPVVLRKSEQIIEKMFAQEEANPPYPKMNAGVVGAYLQILSRSEDPLKSSKAVKILQRLRATGASPLLTTYHSALLVCARSRGSSEERGAALKVAFAIFKTVSVDGLTPNSVTYSTLLFCVGNLMERSPACNEIANATFQKAIKAGYVDYGIIKNMQKACDAHFFQTVVQHEGTRPVHVSKLPSSWTKNAQPKPIYKQ